MGDKKPIELAKEDCEGSSFDCDCLWGTGFIEGEYAHPKAFNYKKNTVLFEKNEIS